MTELTKSETGDVRGSSAARSAAGHRSGNHPVPPAERHPPFNTSGEDDPARKDPRYERDQKVYEMAVTGKLGQVPPSEAEQIAVQARSGIPKEAHENAPKTPQEQIEDDMKRLREGERLSAEARKAPITAGEQEQEPKNNLGAYKAEGKQVGSRGFEQTDIEKQEKGEHII